jgi:multidrug efflux pump subunit AcrB
VLPEDILVSELGFYLFYPFGIIVMIGIVINDSILKIDTVNKLIRIEKIELLEAIHIGGNRRLRPILMTSLTTILALVPILWGGDLGSMIQTPLAITIIAGLFFGTLVSLFIVPLIYWVFYRKRTIDANC